MKTIAAALLGPLLACSGWAQDPVTTIRDITLLTPEQAGEKRPVRVEATLIFHDFSRKTYFVHDGTASCRVVMAGEMGRDLKLLDRVRIEGVTRAGGYLSDLTAERVTVTGRGVEPEPQVLTGEHLFDTDACAQWVEVEGRVKGTRATDGGLALDLAVQGWTIPAVLPGDVRLAAPPWHLMERRVRVRGIAGTLFNQERQMTGRYLHVPGMEHLVTVSGPEGADATEDSPVTGLLRPHSDPARRVRLRGVVTHVIPGEAIFLRDASGSTRVGTAQPLAVAAGDEVEAEGLPAMEMYRPGLRAIELRRLDGGPPPPPRPFKPEGKRRTIEHHELVTAEARILAVQSGANNHRLQCQSGAKTFDALLERRLGSTLPPGLTPGSRVSLTGICELTSTRFLFLPEYVDDFRLHLRGPGDIAVLSRPSWWTAERLLWLVGALVLFGGAAAGWAVLLRWRVSVQTRIIRDKVARETVLEERQRIARDWHDTMEQQLMGVSLLVEDAAARLAAENPPGAAEERLTLAQRMIRHCREESRASIRDLRSVALEAGGLPAAFEELLAPLARAAGAAFALNVTGTPVRLPGHGEHQVLRIAQEAVANAAKHAEAATIRVQLGYRPGGLTLEVFDDGRGFNPAAAGAPTGGGGLGLATMRERAARLGARLTLTSEPGAGTRVQLDWDAPAGGAA